jgi:hypothetical protein
MTRKPRAFDRRTFTTLAAAGAVAATLGLGATAQAKTFYKMSTLGPGSSPYLVMTTFANIINKKVPDTEIQVNATGVATRHAVEAARGDIDLFMTAPILYDFLRDRKAMYKKVEDGPELVKNLRSIMAFPIGLYHIVVYDDSGITSMDQIKGKKVFLGPPGGSALRTATMIVKGATGLEPGKDFESVKLGWDAAGAAFQDRRIDVYFNPTNPPSPVISQVALTNKIRLLGLDDKGVNSAEIKDLSSRPGGGLGQIAADAYGANQMNSEPATTISSMVGIAIRKGIPEDVVYNMTKAFWAGVKEIEATAPWMREVKLQDALKEMRMPLHAGALRYYREAGLTVPDNLVPAD